TVRVWLFVIVVGVGSALSSPIAFQAADGPREVTHLIDDAARKQVLLLASPPESTQLQIWRWEGSGWRLLSADGPPARHLGGAAYDTRRGRLVIQGGIGPRDD